MAPRKISSNPTGAPPTLQPGDVSQVLRVVNGVLTNTNLIEPAPGASTHFAPTFSSATVSIGTTANSAVIRLGDWVQNLALVWQSNDTTNHPITSAVVTVDYTDAGTDTVITDLATVTLTGSAATGFTIGFPFAAQIYPNTAGITVRVVLSDGTTSVTLHRTIKVEYPVLAALVPASVTDKASLVAAITAGGVSLYSATTFFEQIATGFPAEIDMNFTATPMKIALLFPTAARQPVSIVDVDSGGLSMFNSRTPPSQNEFFNVGDDFALSFSGGVPSMNCTAYLTTNSYIRASFANIRLGIK